jgi:hypothetical protein
MRVGVTRGTTQSRPRHTLILDWKVKDMDEALYWLKRFPNPMPGHSEIEIRPIDLSPR